MLAVRNAGGWVLALVALSLFGLLLLRGLSGEDAASHEEQVSAGMVMTKNSRDTASEFSAAFETISAQYVPVVVTIHLYPFVGASAGRHENLLSSSARERSTLTEGGSRLGCGVLVSSDGYILTNRHILPNNFGAADSVVVLLNKGRRFSGRVVGSDSLTNLAVIKISTKGLLYAKFGDSDRLRIGQWVIAVGRTGSAAPAITAGLVSAKGSSKVMLPYDDDLIQIDALIGDGHAGGALVDLDGELVGISTTFFAGLGGGAAIPSNLARRVMQSLINDGKVTRGFIGVTSQDRDPTLARALRLSSTLGVLLVDIAPNSPAERAGLRRGDVVLQFAGAVIDNVKTLKNIVAAQAPGTNVQAVVWRDSVKIAFDITPEEIPNAKMAVPTAVAPVKPASGKLGIHIQSLTGEMARQGKRHGVIVSQIEPNSTAARILSAGDIIHEINRKTINNVRDYRAALQTLNAGETALLLVSRGESNFFAGVEVK
jgi:serine protease Do